MNHILFFTEWLLLNLNYFHLQFAHTTKTSLNKHIDSVYLIRNSEAEVSKTCLVKYLNMMQLKC